MRILLLATAVAISYASNASAEGCQSSRDAVSVVKHIFDAADRNRDGLLTQVEYEEAGLQNFGVPFSESDANSDGTTSIDEYMALYQRHHPPVDGAEA